MNRAMDGERTHHLGHGRADPVRVPVVVRRRKSRVVAGLVAAMMGGRVFAALYLRAGDRAELVAMASSVQRHDHIERSDLRVVRVGTVGEKVSLVPAGELEGLVGGVASSDLVAGTLLAPGQIGGGDERVLADDEAVVSIVMPVGSYPSRQRRGDQVLLVMRPDGGNGALPINVLNGWVWRADRDPLSSGDQPIEVAIERTQAAGLVAAAAEGRVTVVSLSG